MSEQRDRIAEIEALKPNWDSYGSLAIDNRAIEVARKLLATQGEAVPMSNGGIAIVWFANGQEFTLEIAPDGTQHFEDCAHVRDLEAELKGWQDYWGSDSPHDSHVASGTSDPYIRQLGKEQARANQLENRVRELEADKARLDWMESRKDDCSWSRKSWAPSYYTAELVPAEPGTKWTEGKQTHATLREAIDAAKAFAEAELERILVDALERLRGKA